MQASKQAGRRAGGRTDLSQPESEAARWKEKEKKDGLTGIVHVVCMCVFVRMYVCTYVRTRRCTYKRVDKGGGYVRRGEQKRPSELPYLPSYLMT
ncbi:hypothetical protein LX36DRAFT_260450 [Colletotrichum falcatum]|nr:hypothetical protein LX36DRAFT_260450 [Colletotrichum falcatum]